MVVAYLATNRPPYFAPLEVSILYLILVNTNSHWLSSGICRPGTGMYFLARHRFYLLQSLSSSQNIDYASQYPSLGQIVHENEIWPFYVGHPIQVFIQIFVVSTTDCIMFLRRIIPASYRDPLPDETFF
jgi:hypothetical protein